ncbi:MAG: RDD family protein [Bacteroidota bacterium]
MRDNKIGEYRKPIAASGLVSFFTLTLPVFLYFYLMEKSNMAATFGKRIIRISIFTSRKNKPRSIFLRNFLKFIPWEIAHVGVHWMVYYSARGTSPPLWVWITLLGPQLIVFSYLVSVVVYRGESSLYDQLAHTYVKRRDPETKE